MSVNMTLSRADEPIEPGVVAMLRLPVGIRGMDSLVKALEKMYEPNLVILTDAPQSAEWLVIAKPEVTA